MPWCEQCGRQVADEDLVDDRDCPTCGDELVDRGGIPWHFKLMAVATAIYLLYRAFQGVEWVVHHV